MTKRVGQGAKVVKCLFVGVILFLGVIVPSFGEPEWRSKDGQAFASRHHGFWEVHLFGSDAQMASQHGELLLHVFGEHKEEHALHFFLTFFDEVIAQISPLDWEWLKNTVKESFDYLTESMAKNAPYFMRQYAKGSYSVLSHQYTLEQLQNGYVYPDRGELLHAIVFGAVSPMGCSMTVCRPEMGDPLDSQKRMWLAGSFEFNGGYEWMHNQAAITFHPKHGQAFTAMSTLGLQTGGIRTVNAHGVYVGLQVLPLDAVEVGGDVWPILAITEDIVRRSTDVDHAVELLETHVELDHVATPWIITLAGPGKDGNVSVRSFDVTPHVLKERCGCESTVCTNHTTDAILEKKFLNVTPTVKLFSQERFRILEEGHRKQKPVSLTDHEQLQFRVVNPATIFTFTVVWDPAGNQIRISNMPRWLDSHQAYMISFPFPDEIGTVWEELIPIPAESAKAYALMSKARNRHARYPRDPDEILSLYESAMADFSPDRIPSGWKLGLALLILEDGVWKSGKSAELFHPYAVRALALLEDIIEAGDRMPEVPPAFGAFLLNPMQKLAVLSWTFMLQEVLDAPHRMQFSHLAQLVADAPSEYQPHMTPWLQQAKDVTDAKDNTEQYALINALVWSAPWTLEFADYFFLEEPKWGALYRLSELLLRRFWSSIW